MDRFFLSTYAYQIDGRGLPEDQIRSANALATGGLIPDLTIILEMTATEGMERAAARGGQDRIEQLGDEFHARVERGFARFGSGDWQKLHVEAGPIVSVDGRGGPSEVHERIVAALAQNLPDRFEMLAQGNRS
jgi:dTMP kinase